jgi:protease-4
VLTLLVLALLGSLLFNAVLFSVARLSVGEGSTLEEHFHSGKKRATDKIAIVRVDGVLMEGMTTYARKQIERAARDEDVKAVVLRIDSPGGSITASDDLFKRIRDLRDGKAPNQKPGKKPVVVSMGGVAASGGYYIAMAGGGSAPQVGSTSPPKYLFAERSTMTGSIGVYAAFPNVHELTDKWGIRMNVIKAGNIKDSGSMFKAMKPEEEIVWQTMVDEAYLQFIQVVEEGRPHLKGKLQEDIQIDQTLPVRNGKDSQQQLKYTRYRADGGIFTAEDAKKYGLIDTVGYLDDAIAEARTQAGLTDNYEVIQYERPISLASALLGAQQSKQLDPSRLAQAAVPRLWYLAPQSDLAGILAAMGRE